MPRFSVAAPMRIISICRDFPITDRVCYTIYTETFLGSLGALLSSLFFSFFFFFLFFFHVILVPRSREKRGVSFLLYQSLAFFHVFILPFRFSSFSTFRGTSLVSTRFFSSGDKREGGEEQGTHGRRSGEERKRGGAERERVTRILLPRSMFRNTRAFIHEHATTETSHSPSLSPDRVTETRVVGLSPARFNGVINGRYRGG